MARNGSLVGLDVGTTGVKALAVSTTGEVVARAEEEYALSTPRPGWSEQDPEDWWRAAQTVIARLPYDEVRLVEVDGQVLRVGRRRGAARSARPLLIFNGIGANLEMLEPFVQALQDIEVEQKLLFPGGSGHDKERLPSYSDHPLDLLLL